MKIISEGGQSIAPDSLVGEFVFVERIKFVDLPLLFLSLQIKFQYGKRHPPLIPVLGKVVSLVSVLPFLVRLFVSFATDTYK